MMITPMWAEFSSYPNYKPYLATQYCTRTCGPGMGVGDTPALAWPIAKWGRQSLGGNMGKCCRYVSISIELPAHPLINNVGTPDRLEGLHLVLG